MGMGKNGEKNVNICVLGLNIFRFQITNLSPSTSYMFIIRAENGYGYSAPSPTSAIIRTLSANDGVTMPEEIETARLLLSGQVSVFCFCSAISYALLVSLYNSIKLLPPVT